MIYKDDLFISDRMLLWLVQFYKWRYWVFRRLNNFLIVKLLLRSLPAQVLRTVGWKGVQRFLGRKAAWTMTQTENRRGNWYKSSLQQSLYYISYAEINFLLPWFCLTLVLLPKSFQGQSWHFFAVKNVLVKLLKALGIWGFGEEYKHRKLHSRMLRNHRIYW